MSRNECFLLLGGAGLVGKQVAREIAKHLSPRKIVIGSLYQREVDATLDELKAIFTNQPVEWEGFSGNIFVRDELSEKTRGELLGDPQSRKVLYDDLFGNMDSAYETSRLVKLIREHQPDVIIDSINTATAISYQDALTASVIARRDFQKLLDNPTSAEKQASAQRAIDTMMLSEALPQLVRHSQMLYRAMQEVGTRMYLKIGTTGTGGMGLNIPYTHSEDRPSFKLMTKTAVAFAHTGLMFLMARTPNGPIVKEIKPGAMIGYADVCSQTVREKGQPIYIYESRTETLSDKLNLRDDNGYKQLRTLDLPVVDTGENGLFTRGEFETITALRQMEFITPEEIAREARLEIMGSNTGRDVIAEIDSAIMNPSYRAGYLRQRVLEDMITMEKETDTHSVALGQLGPPELSKLLWEAELFKSEYGKVGDVLDHSPEAISKRLFQRVQSDSQIRQAMTSIGLPILTPDGKHLIRGPYIRIPEVPGENEVELQAENLDEWAKKGWVDLRPANCQTWLNRFQMLHDSRQRIRMRGSASVAREAYLFDNIRIGEIVGWIFNNEQAGYRIK